MLILKLVFSYNKCYISPEVGTLREKFAPSPSKIPHKLGTVCCQGEAAMQCPDKVTNLMNFYDCNPS